MAEPCPRCGSTTNFHVGHGFDIADLLTPEQLAELERQLKADKDDDGSPSVPLSEHS